MYSACTPNHSTPLEGTDQAEKTDTNWLDKGFRSAAPAFQNNQNGVQQAGSTTGPDS
ncbi:MAG: hypothetical protein FD134_120 [Gallionellaceae bacterium]|nr:MAG: hypothetical protein FD134_120 [Gallionellaceae bacterium]